MKLGKLGLHGGKWVVTVRPHIAIKVKRIFPRATQVHRSDISGVAVGTIIITDNLEVRRDLLWLIDRYPLEVSAEDLETLRKGGEQFDRRATDIEEILSGRASLQEYKLAIPLREYQKQASEVWLRHFGLLLADQLGLGKTAVGISGVVRPEMRPALVVVEAHLQLQWEAEIRRFFPGIWVHTLKIGRPYDVRDIRKVPKNQTCLFDDGEFPSVFISTYHKLDGWVDVFRGFIKGVVFDEVQALRHADTNRYAAAMQIAHAAIWRIGLSATPVCNFGGEMFNIMEVLRPGELGSRDEFLQEWCHHDEKARVRDPKAFGTYLRESGLMIRRTRIDVGREIPALSKIPIDIPCDTKALDGLVGADELAKIILSQGSDPLKKGQAAREFDWRLRQATGIAKAPYVAEFVKMLLESEERVLLSGWHLAVYDIWKHRLKAYNPVFYTGESSPFQKNAAAKAFISGRSRVMVISNRSGTGLDGLQKVCRIVTIGELDWSPVVHDQIIGRVHRDGQEEPVMAYFPVANSGSDPVVADVLGLKKAQIEGIQDPTGGEVVGDVVDPNHIKKLAEHYLSMKGKGT